MDAAVWIVLAVLGLGALGAGGVALAARGVELPGGLAVAGARFRRHPAAVGAPPAVEDPAVLEPRPLAADGAIDIPAPSPIRRRAGPLPELDPLAADPGSALRPALEALDRRLIRLEERLDAASRELRDEAAAVRRLLVEAAPAVEAVRVGVAADLSGFDLRQSAGLDRLRGEVLDAVSQAATRSGAEPALSRAMERRADCAADLYALVARLESAIAQVTNPVLLPGETYAPPSDFLPEALAWENWKDVGERAFALADGFSAQRVYLSDGARAEVAGFVTTLRGVLTRVVYPNLAVDATPAQIDALRGALGTLAAALPSIRHCLEREYREASEIRSADGA